MTTIKKHLLTGILVLFVTVGFAHSGNDKITKENVGTKTETEIAERVEVLKSRIEEIKSKDLSSLDRSERKAYKDELKEIKKELKTAGSTVTISVGALIIIILLLIIIL